MTSRGTKTSLLVALPVAFFSGLGVAVSLLDDQTSSLVGVAISASLLPPAVNAGILWVCHFFVQAGIVPEILPVLHPILPGETLPPGETPVNYSNRGEGGLDGGEKCVNEGDTNCYEVKEYMAMGWNSLEITLANIALIMVSSMLM